MVRIEEDGLVAEGESMREAQKALRKAKRAEEKERARVRALAIVAETRAYATLGQVGAHPHTRWYPVLPGSSYLDNRIHFDSQNHVRLRVDYIEEDKIKHAEREFYGMKILGILERSSGATMAIHLEEISNGERSWYAIGAYEGIIATIDAGELAPLLDAMVAEEVPDAAPQS